MLHPYAFACRQTALASDESKVRLFHNRGRATVVEAKRNLYYYFYDLHYCQVMDSKVVGGDRIQLDK